MAKQSISGRVAQLARADIPALLERSEDPEFLVDQLVADYTMTIAEAESIVVQTGASLRLLEQDQAEDAEASRAWAARARDTAAKAAGQHAAGGGSAADRLDTLTLLAREEQGWAEGQAIEAQPVIDALTALIARLEAGLTSLRTTLDALTSRREELISNAQSVERRRTAPRILDVLDPEESLTHFDYLVKDEEP